MGRQEIREKGTRGERGWVGNSCRQGQPEEIVVVVVVVVLLGRKAGGRCIAMEFCSRSINYTL